VNDSAGLLDVIVADALEQAEDLLELDGPRAEAWASDLAALADEAGPGGLAQLVERLRDAGTPAASAALWALDAVTDGVDPIDGVLPPPWADSLATSRSTGSSMLTARRGESIVLHFIDAVDVGHVVIVDLLPAEIGAAAETIGEVHVGPPDILDGIDEEDADITVSSLPAPDAAARIVRALAATETPLGSLVANGRLLLSRLREWVDDPGEAPRFAAAPVPDLPPRDRDDDAYASDILHRALGAPSAIDDQAVADAASSLREAAAADEPIAQWLAASTGPVDLDEPDLDVVLAALAATVAPATLEPLDADARTAVVDLEWADWLGAVIGAVRGGPGTPVDGEALVDLVNRCPEVTSTIPKHDRARVAWAFAVCTEIHSRLGLIEDGRLTDLGAALWPRALGAAWATSE